MMLLTRLPAGRIGGDAPGLAASGWAWPLVGGLIGGLAAAVFGIAAWLGLPATMAALLALAAGALATGAMHEDGLADLVDGFGGGGDRAAKLRIMRDSQIGSYGTLALILSVGLRWAAITALAGTGLAVLALIGVAAASRAGLPLALSLMPAARDNGLGHMAARDGAPGALIAVGIGAIFLLPLGLLPALIVGAAMACACLFLGRIALRQIGGQTGDVLGAMQQCAELAGWIAIVALAG